MKGFPQATPREHNAGTFSLTLTCGTRPSAACGDLNLAANHINGVAEIAEEDGKKGVAKGVQGGAGRFQVVRALRRAGVLKLSGGEVDRLSAPGGRLADDLVAVVLDRVHLAIHHDARGLPVFVDVDVSVGLRNDHFRLAFAFEVSKEVRVTGVVFHGDDDLAIVLESTLGGCARRKVDERGRKVERESNRKGSRLHVCLGGTSTVIPQI